MIIKGQSKVKHQKKQIKTLTDNSCIKNEINWNKNA